MPESSSTLAEDFRNARRDRCTRKGVLAERRDGEQVFAVAGMKSGEREREEGFRSLSTAAAV
jgi:hypothetical protein